MTEAIASARFTWLARGFVSLSLSDDTDIGAGLVARVGK